MGEEADLRTELFLRSLELAYLEERARAYAPLKMLIDFVGAFALLVALSPILFVCALLTKLEQPWEPVFFLQWRLGHRAKPFRIFKFRTMRPARETASHAAREGRSRVSGHEARGFPAQVQTRRVAAAL